jgi:hypothetical protein
MMLIEDPMYLAVLSELADGSWRDPRSIERALESKGFSLRQTCRVGYLLEGACEEKIPIAEYRIFKGPEQPFGAYRLTGQGIALLAAPKPEKKKAQRGLF